MCSGTVISVLEKLLAQSTEQDNPSRLVIEAAHGSASKVRELLQKYPDKVSAAVLAALQSGRRWGWGKHTCGKVRLLVYYTGMPIVICSVFTLIQQIAFC